MKLGRHANPASVRSVTAKMLNLIGRSLFISSVGWQPGEFGRVNLPSRHAILLFGPTVEIDQLAALGTKWPPRIVLPFNGLFAARTFAHTAKLREERRQRKLTGK